MRDKVADRVKSAGPGKQGLKVLLSFSKEIRRVPSVAFKRRLVKREGTHAVGYIGGIGHDNLGDQLLFEAIQGALDDFQILPLLAEPVERLLTRFGLGGQSLFRAVLLSGSALSNPFCLRLAKFVRELGLPLYTVGAGVGNPGIGILPASETLPGWKGLLQDCDFLSIRGPVSASAVRKAGIVGGEVIGDVALGLAPETIPPFRTRRRLAINLAQGSGHYAVFDDIAAIAADFQASGGEVVGLALGSGDRAALEDLRRRPGLEHMSIEDHTESGLACLASIGGNTALIGVRLHSAVLACCLGVPSILLEYSSECRDFMQGMHLEDFCTPIDGERSGPLLRASWRRILSEPGLGEQIYRQAIFWKRKQQSYYARLTDRLNEEPISLPEWARSPRHLTRT